MPTRLPAGIGFWRLAVALHVDELGATVGVEGGVTARMPFAELVWARRRLPDQRVGPVPERPADVLKVGGVAAVDRVTAGAAPSV